MDGNDDQHPRLSISPLSKMCTRYSLTKGQKEIIALINAMYDNAGNVPPMPAIYPDGVAPVVRNADGSSELIKMRWGFPGPLAQKFDSAPSEFSATVHAFVSKPRLARV
jgi:putative SOS response-associated peptidase YedK